MLLFAFALATATTTGAAAPQNPHTLVDSAIVALQRTASLKDIRSIKLTGAQHEWILGNAERAEEFGKRNGVPGELVVRIRPTKVIAAFGLAE